MSSTMFAHNPQLNSVAARRAKRFGANERKKRRRLASGGTVLPLGKSAQDLDAADSAALDIRIDDLVTRHFSGPTKDPKGDKVLAFKPQVEAVCEAAKSCGKTGVVDDGNQVIAQGVSYFVTNNPGLAASNLATMNEQLKDCNPLALQTKVAREAVDAVARAGFSGSLTPLRRRPTNTPGSAGS